LEAKAVKLSIYIYIYIYIIYICITSPASLWQALGCHGVGHAGAVGSEPSQRLKSLRSDQANFMWLWKYSRQAQEVDSFQCFWAAMGQNIQKMDSFDFPQTCLADRVQNGTPNILDLKTNPGTISRPRRTPHAPSWRRTPSRCWSSSPEIIESLSVAYNIQHPLFGGPSEAK
jgi:hypothetical protein